MSRRGRQPRGEAALSETWGGGFDGARIRRWRVALRLGCARTNKPSDSMCRTKKSRRQSLT